MQPMTNTQGHAQSSSNFMPCFAACAHACKPLAKTCTLWPNHARTVRHGLADVVRLTRSIVEASSSLRLSTLPVQQLLTQARQAVLQPLLVVEPSLAWVENKEAAQQEGMNPASNSLSVKCNCISALFLMAIGLLWWRLTTQQPAIDDIVLV